MDVHQLFTNLQKEAECPLCLETVDNPKTLPCLHSFCLKCLDKHAGFARRQLETTIKCPVCQTSFQIPEGDSFKNLPTSYHLNRLVDVLSLSSKVAQKCSNCEDSKAASSYCFVCQNFLCTACFEAHQRLKATRGHHNVMIENLRAQDVQEFIHRPVMCSQEYHENQPLEFYCEECTVLICHKCSIISHNGHTMTDTRKAAELQKMQMMEALEKVRAKTVIFEKDASKQTEVMKKNRNEILSSEKKMKDTVGEFIRELREHEITMKSKLAEIHEGQRKQQVTQLENFELELTQLKNFVEQGESIVERNISTEILQANKAIIRRCEELLNASQPEICKVSHVHYTVEKKADIFYRIVISDTDPSLSLADVGSLRQIREKTESNNTIVTRDSDGKQYYNKDDQIKVNISTPAGDQLETEITDTKDGKYTVTYTPQCVGQHRVEIQVNGEPLTGSPWVVQVIPHQYQFAFQFGSKGKEQGQFDFPLFIAVSDKTERVAVYDNKNMRTQIFEFDGKFLKEKGASFPFTSSDGDFIFVSADDSFTHYVLSTEEGQHIRNVYCEHMKERSCIVFDYNGRLIISYKSDKTIKVLTPDGKHVLQSFKAPGCDEVPYYAIHHQHKFFVSYADANCVMVFNDTGEYLFDIGSKGSGDGQFMEPMGLAVDKFNHLIVCDVGNQRLQLFTLDGNFVSKIEGRFFENSRICYCAVSFFYWTFVCC